MHKTCTALHVLSALALIGVGFMFCDAPVVAGDETAVDSTAVVNAWVPIVIGLFQIGLKILELYGIKIFDFIKSPNSDDDDDSPPSPLRPVFSQPDIPFSLAIAATLCFASVSLAGQPRAVISGPSAAAAGDQIQLSAKQSIADLYRWTVTRRTAGPVRFSESPDRSELSLNSYPGVYDVTLIVANSDGIDVAQSTITVFNTSVPGPSPAPPTPVPIPEPQPQPQPVPPPTPSPEPQPAPTPTPPTPDPEPVIPDGRFAISKAVYERAKVIPLPARSVAPK
ncbi:MAG TPA: hypothetical protein VNQ76_21160, partial [Planctomicrobium sp.]|nr:hypothetical protein [Planctomicrobium sp.]